MKRSVCLVNLNCYCLFNPASRAPMGGAELDMYTLARGLAQSGATGDVSVVTGDWGQPFEEMCEGVRVIRGPRVGDRSQLRALWGLFRALIRAKAATYLSTGAGPEVGLIALFCKVTGRRYIYRTAHIVDCNGEYIAKSGIAGKLFRYGLRRASAITVTVREHAQVLAQHHPEITAPVTFVPLGIEERSSVPMPSEKKGVLWVARCDTWKRPELMLELARQIEAEVTMICPPHSRNRGLYDEIRLAASKIPNLHLIEYVPYREMQPYYDRARVFVNTSDYEGFTYTLIHCGIAGTPVAYLRVNPDKVITTENIGRWADGEMAVLVDQVRELLRDGKAWQKCSQAIAAYARREHGIDHLLPAWLEVLSGIE